MLLSWIHNQIKLQAHVSRGGGNRTQLRPWGCHPLNFFPVQAAVGPPPSLCSTVVLFSPAHMLTWLSSKSSPRSGSPSAARHGPGSPRLCPLQVSPRSLARSHFMADPQDTWTLWSQRFDLKGITSTLLELFAMCFHMPRPTCGSPGRRTPWPGTFLCVRP